MIVGALLLIAAGWFEGAAPAKADHRVALDVKGGEILLTPIRFEMESTLQFPLPRKSVPSFPSA